jgi:hypothetical protein
MQLKSMVLMLWLFENACKIKGGQTIFGAALIKGLSTYYATSQMGVGALWPSSRMPLIDFGMKAPRSSKETAQEMHL